MDPLKKILAKTAPSFTEAQLAQYAEAQRKDDAWELGYAKRKLAERPTGWMSDSYRNRIKELSR